MVLLAPSYQIFLALVLFSVHGAFWGGSIWLQSLGILLLQAGLGCLLGITCGFLISRFVKYIEEPLIETTITIVAAYGVYLLADFLHTSGSAVIITGLIDGYHGEGDAMSDRTKEVVDNFWSMIAFLANALLFLLVGIQLNPLSLLASNDAQQRLLTAAVALNPKVFSARLVMVILLPRFALDAGKRLHSWRFLIFWSGLRGALSLALVLALPLCAQSKSMNLRK